MRQNRSEINSVLVLYMHVVALAAFVMMTRSMLATR